MDSSSLDLYYGKNWLGATIPLVTTRARVSSSLPSPTILGDRSSSKKAVTMDVDPFGANFSSSSSLRSGFSTTKFWKIQTTPRSNTYTPTLVIK